MTLFIMARALDNNLLVLLFSLLLIPVSWLAVKLIRADTRKDFRQISNLCKVIMLLGLITMIWT